MKSKTIARNLALIVIFGSVGLMRFTDGVRTVQALGLLTCGAVIGSALTLIITALKIREKTE